MNSPKVNFFWPYLARILSSLFFEIEMKCGAFWSGVVFMLGGQIDCKLKLPVDMLRVHPMKANHDEN